MRKITNVICGIICGALICCSTVSCNHKQVGKTEHAGIVTTTSVTESTTSTSITTTTTTMTSTGTQSLTTSAKTTTAKSTTTTSSTSTETIYVAQIEETEATQEVPVNDVTEQKNEVVTNSPTTQITTTTIETTLPPEATTVECQANSISISKDFVKTFNRCTYYAYGHGGLCGGSGRSLIDCSYGNGTVKGSIASSYLYSNYGYNYNGSRTMVYLEVSQYPQMTGYYYLDDCCAFYLNDTIDFYYDYNSNCPFQYQGVISADCYIITEN